MLPCVRGASPTSLILFIVLKYLPIYTVEHLKHLHTLWLALVMKGSTTLSRSLATCLEMHGAVGTVAEVGIWQLHTKMSSVTSFFDFVY